MEGLEVNKLIVESHNDKYFIEALLQELNIIDLQIEEPLCNVYEYICLDGIGNLKNKLQNMKLDEIDKIGIILDADKVGIDNRLKEINILFKDLNIDIEFTQNNDFQKDDINDMSVGIHILNIDGYGELEDILYKIKIKDSIFADCLNGWKKCIEENQKEISQKDFIKFWINNYIRYDTCTKKEQKRVSEKCNFEKAMQKDIWNYKDNVLDDLKEFLLKFKDMNNV